MLHDARTNSLILKAPDALAVREAIPQSRMIDHPDYNVQVRFTEEASRVLRNMGFHVPTPGLFAYNWPGKYKPMNHQRAMVDFYLEHRRCFNLSEMGTGKTAATLWAADLLMTQGKVRKALVLSPLSTLERVWQQDTFDVLMHRKTAIVHGGQEKRTKALNMNVDFYILNHDGIVLKDVLDILKRRKDIDLIIVDEGSMFRNHATQKWKALCGAVQPHHRIWWVTGTPVPTQPTDAWPQSKIICPDRLEKMGAKFPGQFKRKTMMQLSPFKWAPQRGSEKIVHDVMQPAIRFRKKDCMDLPPVTTRDIQATLTKEQRQYFKIMKDEMILLRDSGEQITAVNAADKINKLRQILCGAIKDPTSGEYVTLPHAPRLEVLLEAIEGAAAKAIVVVPFKGIINVLEREVAKHYSVSVLNGDVSIGARNRTITQFKTQDDPRVLLCHPKVMSHGLNFTEADVLIFYSPIYSNDEFQQVVERINRAGQVNPMTIIRIGAHPLEWEIYRIVDTRRASQDNILKLYETAVV